MVRNLVSNLGPLAVAGVLVVATLAGTAPGAIAQERQTIRVGLVDGASSTAFSAYPDADLVRADGTVVGQVHGREGWVATSAGGQLTLTGPASQLAVQGPVRLNPHAGSGVPMVWVAGHWYRGVLELRAKNRGVEAINELAVEPYLYGVVPEEMPAGWPLESLKAQAVAARTYALSSLGSFGDYDVKPTTVSQVYGGASSERASSNSAVDGTAGQVLTYGGKVIRAYFCADAGGYTDDPVEVWGESYPYLRAVPDFDQDSPHYVWRKTLPAAQVKSALVGIGCAVGEVRDLVPLDRSFAGRVKHLKVVGTTGDQVITGAKARFAFALDSTLFNVAGAEPDGAGLPTVFGFAGRGWGHGLGLSQWGARGLANRGYTYDQILAHYYPTTQLARVGGGGGACGPGSSRVGERPVGRQ